MTDEIHDIDSALHTEALSSLLGTRVETVHFFMLQRRVIVGTLTSVDVSCHLCTVDFGDRGTEVRPTSTVRPVKREQLREILNGESKDSDASSVPIAQ